MSDAPPVVDVVVSTVDVGVRDLVRAAVLAEEAGFDAVWTYDHVSGAVLGGRAVLDVWTVLAGMATATSRVTLGPLVLNAPVREPVHIATAVATLQQLAQGRVTVGLGAGAGPDDRFARELTMFGVEVHDAAWRRTRVAETIELLRALWSGATSYDGSLVHMSDVDAVLLPDPVPRIVVGANGPRMAAIAGRHADGVNLHSWEPDLPRLVDAALGAASAAGRPDPEISVEGPFDDEWLDPSSATRRRLHDLGVRRIMLRWAAPLGTGVIEAAARHLGR